MAKPPPHTAPAVPAEDENDLLAQLLLHGELQSIGKLDTDGDAVITPPEMQQAMAGLLFQGKNDPQPALYGTAFRERIRALVQEKCAQQPIETDERPMQRLFALPNPHTSLDAPITHDLQLLRNGDRESARYLGDLIYKNLIAHGATKSFADEIGGRVQMLINSGHYKETLAHLPIATSGIATDAACSILNEDGHPSAQPLPVFRGWAPVKDQRRS